MPPIGLLLGKVDFASLFYLLDQSKGVPTSLADAKAKGNPSGCLRSLYQRHYQFSDYRVRNLPKRESRELQEEAGSNDQRLPALPDCDSVGGHTLLRLLRCPGSGLIARENQLLDADLAAS